MRILAAVALSRALGSRERMRAVRAKATTGFISGKQATTGRRVKPWARRCGATTSSALQMVGVSQAVRALRLAALGKLGIGDLRPREHGLHRLLAKRRPGKVFSGGFSGRADWRII